MSNPKLLDVPLAQNADRNDIPVTDSGSTGLFSQQYGWQLINAIPPQNGGKAVKREDFNGVFNLIGDLLYHIQKGYTFEYDSRQLYWKGCKVRDPATGLTYQALNNIPANSTNSPHEDTSNWVICPAEQGYIIPSKAYAVGATANHYALPPSYYLECTTGGTTGATTPVITSVTAGQTINDGSVVWTVRRAVCEADYPKTSFGTAVVNHLLGSRLASLVSAVSTDSLFSKLLKKALEAAGLQYSMGTNGYICLGSLFGGLILQWGVVDFTESQFITVTYPVSFRGPHRFIVSSQNKNSGIVAGFQNGATSGTIQIEQPYNGLSINWFAIGY